MHFRIKLFDCDDFNFIQQYRMEKIKTINKEEVAFHHQSRLTRIRQLVKARYLVFQSNEKEI